MTAPQFFQHLYIGRISGLCLFHRRQTQLVKQQSSKRFCGVDIKFFPCIAVYLLLRRRNPRAQHLAVLSQAICVNLNSGILHIRQHNAKRQLNLLQQSQHTLFLQPLAQHFCQLQHTSRVFTHCLYSLSRIRQRRKCVLTAEQFYVRNLISQISHRQPVCIISSV